MTGKTYKCTIPDWAIPYLMCGEAGGLTAEDRAIIEEWKKSWGGPIAISISDDAGPFFCWGPEFGEAANCYECDVYIRR